MIITKEAVAEFKEIFEKEYGVKYTDQEAHEAAFNLLSYFKLLLEIDQRNKAEKEKIMDEEIDSVDDDLGEDVKELMNDCGLDEDTAERVREIMDTEGLDEDEAIELVDEL